MRGITAPVIPIKGINTIVSGMIINAITTVANDVTLTPLTPMEFISLP